MSMTTNIVVFLSMTTCSLIDRYRNFGGTSCLNFLPEDGGSTNLRHIGNDLQEITAHRIQQEVNLIFLML